MTSGLTLLEVTTALIVAAYAGLPAKSAAAATNQHLNLRELKCVA